MPVTFAIPRCGFFVHSQEKAVRSCNPDGLLLWGLADKLQANIPRFSRQSECILQMIQPGNRAFRRKENRDHIESDFPFHRPVAV